MDLISCPHATGIYDRLASSGSRPRYSNIRCPKRDHPRFPQPDPITVVGSEMGYFHILRSSLFSFYPEYALQCSNQITWEAKVLVRSRASSRTIFKRPCCSARGGYPDEKLNFLRDCEVWKICTYCGALNRPWMRSSTSTPPRDIQPQHEKLNRPDLSRRWTYRVSYLVPCSR